VILRLYLRDLPTIVIHCNTKLGARETLDRWTGKADHAELFRHMDSERPCSSWVPAPGRRGWMRSESI
jgi:hypothetical protein